MVRRYRGPSKWASFCDAAWHGPMSSSGFGLFPIVRLAFKIGLGTVWIGLVIIATAMGAVNAKPGKSHALRDTAISTVVAAAVWMLAFGYTSVRRSNPMVRLYPVSTFLWLPPLIILLVETGGDMKYIEEEGMLFMFLLVVGCWAIAPFSLIFWPFVTLLEESVQRPALYVAEPCCNTNGWLAAD